MKIVSWTCVTCENVKKKEQTDEGADPDLVITEVTRRYTCDVCEQERERRFNKLVALAHERFGRPRARKQLKAVDFDEDFEPVLETANDRKLAKLKARCETELSQSGDKPSPQLIQVSHSRRKKKPEQPDVIKLDEGCKLKEERAKKRQLDAQKRKEARQRRHVGRSGR